MNVKNYVMLKNASKKNGNALRNLVTLIYVIVIILHIYVKKYVLMKSVKINVDYFKIINKNNMIAKNNIIANKNVLYKIVKENV